MEILDSKTGRVLLAIYHNFLLESVGASGSFIDTNDLHMSNVELETSLDVLSCSKLIDQRGVIRKEGLCDSQGAYIAIADCRINEQGIKYLEKRYHIINRLTNQEKLDIVIQELREDSGGALIQEKISVDEAYGNLNDLFERYVLDAERWLQARRDLRTYLSEYQKAQIVFADCFAVTRAKIAENERNGRSDPNGEYIQSCCVKESYGTFPVIIINISGILRKAGHENNASNWFLDNEGKTILIRTLIHEISHYYDDISIPNSLSSNLSEPELKRLFTPFYYYSEMMSRFFQEKYYICHCHERLVDYVRREMDNIDRVLENRSSKDFSYFTAHYLGAVLCWKSHVEYINMHREDICRLDCITNKLLEKCKYGEMLSKLFACNKFYEIEKYLWNLRISQNED